MATPLKSLFQIVIAGAGLVSCDMTRQTPEAENRGGVRVQISESVAERTTGFAFEFLKRLEQSQPADDNFFVSPLSLHVALGMLLNGAEGETADELKKALNVEGVSVDELNEVYETLTEKLPLADPKVELGLANAVWYRNGLEVEREFIASMEEKFKAGVYGEDFNSQATVSKINGWASRHTNGKITRVLDKIDPEDVMFLMNALYFKGDWKYQFDAAKTTEAGFYMSEGHHKTVKMMNVSASLGVVSNNRFVAVQLPYSNGQFHLTLILPKNGSVNDLIRGFEKSDWDQLRSDFHTKIPVQVKLPKFTFKYAANLNETLEALGMKRAFTEKAELGKISQAAKLFVSFVKQDTYLAIDEKGTEAAAVTNIGIGVTSAPSGPQSVVFDKPFLFFISENSSNTVQFMGRVMNP